MPCLRFNLLLLLEIEGLSQLLGYPLESQVALKLDVTEQLLDDEVLVEDLVQSPRKILGGEHPLQSSLPLHVEHSELLLQKWSKVLLNVLAGILALEFCEMGVVVVL